MKCIGYYNTPTNFSSIRFESENGILTKLYFVEERKESGDLSSFQEVIKWLDEYFEGKNPSFTPQYELKNLTEFQREVNQEIQTIPYGKVITYKEIAERIAKRKGIQKMSAQAVGQAVGRNPISLIIPCHRVIGVNGILVGYGGGLENKISLLELEGWKKEDFHFPRRTK